MSNEKAKALEMAISQIEKNFGKGSIMKMGEASKLHVEVISSAENSGLSEESFSNIKEGKAPGLKKTAEELAVEDGVVEEAVVKESFPLWVIIIVILAMAIIGVILYFIRRKKV